MERTGHSEGCEAGDMGSAFEAAGLVHCWAAALGIVRAVVLAKVIHAPLECGILETSFSLVSMPWVYLSTFPGCRGGGCHFWVGIPHFLGSVGCPLCPFQETQSAPPSCSGHSGAGKTEAARKIVQFLSSLEQEQARDRRCQVRSSWPSPGIQEGPSFSFGPGGWSPGLWLTLGGSSRHRGAG